MCYKKCSTYDLFQKNTDFKWTLEILKQFLFSLDKIFHRKETLLIIYCEIRIVKERFFSYILNHDIMFQTITMFNLYDTKLGLVIIYTGLGLATSFFIMKTMTLVMSQGYKFNLLILEEINTYQYARSFGQAQNSTSMTSYPSLRFSCTFHLDRYF